MDTSESPIWITADACMPIAADATASSAYSAPPAGRDPAASQPARKPAISTSSATNTARTCGAQASTPFRGGGASLRTVCHQAIRVPAATPST